MRYSISNTAEYGDLTRGPRIITEQTKAEMKKILAEITSGQFAKEWVAEYQSGMKNFNACTRRITAASWRSSAQAPRHDEVDQRQGSVMLRPVLGFCPSDRPAVMLHNLFVERALL